MPVVPYLIMLGGYGFDQAYRRFAGLRRVLGMIFWTIVGAGLFVYVLKAGGRLHSTRMFDRLLEVHNFSQPATLGIYPGCYMAPYNVLAHGYATMQES